jgi:hypothetical protein
LRASNRVAQDRHRVVELQFVMISGGDIKHVLTSGLAAVPKRLDLRASRQKPASSG